MNEYQILKRTFDDLHIEYQELETQVSQLPSLLIITNRNDEIEFCFDRKGNFKTIYVWDDLGD